MATDERLAALSGGHCFWSWRYKRWRNLGWWRLPRSKLYGELGLVNLLKLIPSMEGYYRQKRQSR